MHPFARSISPRNAAIAGVLALITIPAVSQSGTIPYELPGRPPEYQVTEADLDQLRTTLDTLAERSGASAIEVVVATGSAQVFAHTAPGNDDASDVDTGPASVGRLTRALVGITAARLADRGEIDLDTPAHAFADDFQPLAEAFGRSPTIAEMLSDVAGARPVGTNAYARPLFAPELVGLFDRAPLTRHTPTEASVAAAIFALSDRTKKPFPALLQAELAQGGLPPVTATPFGPVNADAGTLARIFGGVADGSFLRPAAQASLGRVQTGTFDRALGFHARRIESRQGWALDIDDVGAGLFARVDFERRHATVVRIAGEAPPNTGERAVAAVEAVFRSPREDAAYPARTSPRSRTRDIFDRLDANRDGVISFEEGSLDEGEPAAAADANGDELLTIDEWATTMGSYNLR